jgi:glucose-6-phosphate 1-dehydrogenase
MAAQLGLGAAGLPPGSRLAVDKPFGEDAQRARDLNTLLAAVMGADWEQAVFRVDHALGMNRPRFSDWRVIPTAVAVGC